MEKDFLQTLKLDISKKFTLAPYERIAFHKILGYHKSENGIRILLRDLQKGGIIRRSAVSVLKKIAHPEVTNALVDLLVTDDTGEEIINTSSIEGMAVLSNQTYIFKPDWMLNFPGMNISNASVVQISFKASYITKFPFSGTFGETGRLSYINQDVILDDRLNIIVVRYYPLQFHLG